MQPTATPFSTSCRMVSRFSLHVRPGRSASVSRPAAAPARHRSAPVIARDALGVNASRVRVRLPCLGHPVTHGGKPLGLGVRYALKAESPDPAGGAGGTSRRAFK